MSCYPGQGALDIAKRELQTCGQRLDAKELLTLLRCVDTCQGTPHTRLAMQLMALTFVRTGELIGAH